MKLNHLSSTLRRPIIVIFILITSISAFAVSPVRAQQNPTYSITVDGIGTASGQPDVAFVDLGIELFNTSLETARNTSADTAGAITQALVTLGVSQTDIQTNAISVIPQDRIDPRTGPTGNFIYRVRTILRVTIRNVSQVNQIISAAISAGANSIDNFTYGVSDITPLEEKARAAAVKNAGDRAKQLADGFGLAVGDPIIVSENVTTTTTPITPVGGDIRGAAVDKSGANGNIGQLLVTVRVQVTYTIRTQR